MKQVFLLIFLLLPTFAFASSGDERDAVKSKENYVYNKSFSQQITYQEALTGASFIGNDQEIHIWGIEPPPQGSDLDYAATLFLETLINEGELICRPKNNADLKFMQCNIDGLDVASSIVRMGMAKDLESQSKGFYADDEELARSHKRGMWRNRE